jgi:DNA-binding GntR family transcriptional regulator
MDQSTQDFTIDRRLPASQQVYEDLRAKIVALALKPGEALSRPSLAESYGLSQTPVRDAFLKLQQEGLVEIYPQSRTMVTRIDVAQAREAQFLRTAIEMRRSAPWL